VTWLVRTPYQACRAISNSGDQCQIADTSSARGQARLDGGSGRSFDGGYSMRKQSTGHQSPINFLPLWGLSVTRRGNHAHIFECLGGYRPSKKENGGFSCRKSGW
jgi:hypothetical protein